MERYENEAPNSAAIWPVIASRTFGFIWGNSIEPPRLGYDPGMSKRATVLVLVLGLGVMTVAARQGTAPAQTGATLTPGARWLRAVDAWEAGSYPAALEDLRTLLKSPAAAEYVDRAAALTGEPFVTIEITPDGADPKISTNGQYLAYEAGNPTVTRLVQVAVSPKVIAELATTEVAFDRSGRRLAWLRTAAGGAATEIVVRDLAAGSDRVWLADPMPKASLGWSGDDQSVVFVGADAADASRSDIYLAREGAPARRLTDPAQPAHKTNLQIGANGTIAYSLSAGSPFGRGGGAPGGGRGGGAPGGRGGAPGAGGPPPPNYGIVNAAGVSPCRCRCRPTARRSPCCSGRPKAPRRSASPLPRRISRRLCAPSPRPSGCRRRRCLRTASASPTS
jgi:hypothetical protein